ncbi:MAG: energy-coupling factor transporter transmembrane protein EcfT [Desulfurococcales archaeon]|nr:energy-coupling factor transporter transmembrane protein EcfT [Desulfurococcales archaeon]
MIPWLLQRIEAALNYEAGRGLVYRAHAGLKLVGLAFSWASVLVAQGLPMHLASLSYPLLLHALAGRVKARYAFISSAVPALLIGAAALVLSPYRPLTLEWLERSIVLTLRVYALASAGLLTFSTTPPTRLAGLVSRRFPLLHDTLILAYRLAPLATIDLARAYVSQRLLGKGVRDPLVGAVLEELYRARMIEVSLYTRGVEPGKPRSPLDDPGDPVLGMLLAGAGLLALAVVIAWRLLA